MADYNVNMKQWNGTSFDNVLPLAYNAKQLDGKTYDEVWNIIKQYVDDNDKLNAKFVVSSYVGTGTSGSIANSNILTFNFTPILVVINAQDHSEYPSPCILVRDSKKTLSQVGADRSYNINVSWGNNDVSWYNTDTYSGYQLNWKGRVYCFVAIGY